MSRKDEGITEVVISKGQVVVIGVQVVRTGAQVVRTSLEVVINRLQVVIKSSLASITPMFSTNLFKNALNLNSGVPV